MRHALLAAALLLGTAAMTAAPVPAAAQTAPSMAGMKEPLVLGHRGASGYRPEHTLASYALAIEMGADFIEPDLVSTKDGRLVARHEPEIGATTDAPQKFPDRKTKKMVDGKEVEGWFTTDFTLAELKTLRAKQPRSIRANAWDGLLEIPTLEEIIELALNKTQEKGRTIGIYPETKHPTFHDQLGLSLEEPLLAILAKYGYTAPDSAVFIQSFEVANLQELATKTKVRLIQLFDEAQMSPYDFVVKGDKRTYADLMKPDELKKIAGYAYGIGPWKRTIVLQNDDKTLKPANSLITDAHAAGLKVHPYTFRDEPVFLAADYRLDPAAEYRHFFELGVDGLFTDFPDTAFRARAEFWKNKP